MEAQNTTTTGAMPTTVAELQSTTLPNGAIIYFERKQGAEVAKMVEDANACKIYKSLCEATGVKNGGDNDVFSFSVDTVKYQIDTFRMQWAFGKIKDYRNEEFNPLLSAYIDLQRLFNACNKVTVDNGLDAELSYSVGVCTDIAELLLSLARNVVKP